MVIPARDSSEYEITATESEMAAFDGEDDFQTEAEMDAVDFDESFADEDFEDDSPKGRKKR